MQVTVRKTTYVSIVLFVYAMLCSQVYAATIPMIYQAANLSKDGYDYAPSVLWDGGQWRMYHCGYYSGTDSDAIFMSSSLDGVNWSAPSPVLQIGDNGAWDSLHVCDPSVIKDVNFFGFTWAMYYTGVGPQGYNEIGLALSMDGVSWVKLNAPIIGGPACQTSVNYGCGMPSVVNVGTTFYMSHTEFICDGSPLCRTNRARTSSNGLIWDQGVLYQMPELQAGPDFMYSNGIWYSVAGGDGRCGEEVELASELIVYKSTSMHGPKTAVGCLRDLDTHHGADGYIAEQGFYRGPKGQQLANSPDIWLAFGVGSHQFHDYTEDIEIAKLALVDGEEGEGKLVLGLG